MVSVQKNAKKRALALNAKGRRIGEDHHRAKLTNHDVDLIHDLLDARDMLVETYMGLGMPRRKVQLALSKAQLSERWIADKFEISRRTVRDIRSGRKRAQTVEGHTAGA